MKKRVNGASAEKRRKASRPDRIFDVTNTVIMVIVFLIIVYPLYFVVIASVSDPNLVNSGKVILLPKGFNLDAYIHILTNKNILTGFGNSVLYTFVWTVLAVAITVPAGYALSRKDLPCRKFCTLFFVFVMYFQGGLIPTYLVVKDLKLLDSMWAIILPTCLSVYNLIVCRTFFEGTLSEELLDAARVDGANNLKFFFKIALPLSKALVAIMVLFYAIQQWNSYFDAMIYLNSKELFPLQLVLKDILIQAQMNSSGAFGDAESVAAMQRIAELVKYSSIVVASLPMLILYPFVQKYFVKGIMIGSVKG